MNCTGSEGKNQTAMRLAIFMNQPLYQDQDGKYSCRYVNLIDYVFALRFLEKIDLVTIVEKGQGPLQLHIPEHVQIHPILVENKKSTLVYRTKLAGAVLFTLIKCLTSEWLKESKAVGLFAMNGTNMLLATYFTFIKKKKFFFLLRGNRVATVAEGGKKGVLGYIKSLRVRSYDRLLRYLISRGAIVFTQGAGLPEMYQDLPGARVIPLNALISMDTLAEWQEIQKKLQDPVRKLIFVGRLSPEKGLFFLLDAFSKLLEKRQELELHLVGDGPLKEQLEERARSAKLIGKVFLHGFVSHGEQLFEHFDRCNILVMSSYTEGLPRSIVEAMARGLPVVATKVGGIPYFIRSGENGLLYDPDSITGFCKAVLLLVENNEARAKLIAEGYRDAKELTFEKRGKMMIEYLSNSN